MTPEEFNESMSRTAPNTVTKNDREVLIEYTGYGPRRWEAWYRGIDDVVSVGETPFEAYSELD